MTLKRVAWRKRKSQPRVDAPIAREWRQFKPRFLLNGGAKRTHSQSYGLKAPIVMGGSSQPTPRGLGLTKGNSSASAQTNGEIFHPPCTFMAVVHIVSMHTSGSNSAGAFVNAGDEIGPYATPYLWQFQLNRNYAGFMLSTATSGPAKPSAGFTYFVVFRSSSNTSHRLQVWRSDGGYEEASGTTDTSGISFQDGGVFSINSASTGDLRVLQTLLLDEYVPDSKLTEWRDAPWQIFKPRSIYKAAAAGGTTITPFVWHYKQHGMMSILFALVFIQFIIDGLSNANLS